jgi:hypothetical protein
MRDNWKKCWINSVRIPNSPWLKMPIGAKRVISNSRYLIFEIADKKPVLKLAIHLVASPVAGSHRLVRPYLMMQVFALLRLELA